MPGPAREVVRGHRPAAGGEAAGERGQRLLARELARARPAEPSRRAGRTSAAAPRPARCRSARPGPAARGCGSRGRRRSRCPRPRAAAMTSGRLSRRSPASAAASSFALRAMCGLRQPDLLAPALLRRLQPRADEREQPAHVLGRRVVDRAAHQPGAHERALGDRPLDARDRARPHARADRPQRLAVVLRLQGAEQAHDLGRVLAACARRAPGSRGAGARSRRQPCRQDDRMRRAADEFGGLTRVLGTTGNANQGNPSMTTTAADVATQTYVDHRQGRARGDLGRDHEPRPDRSLRLPGPRRDGAAARAAPIARVRARRCATWVRAT